MKNRKKYIILESEEQPKSVKQKIQEFIESWVDNKYLSEEENKELFDKAFKKFVEDLSSNTTQKEVIETPDKVREDSESLGSDKIIKNTPKSVKEKIREFIESWVDNKYLSEEENKELFDKAFKKFLESENLYEGDEVSKLEKELQNKKQELDELKKYLEETTSGMNKQGIGNDKFQELKQKKESTEQKIKDKETEIKSTEEKLTELKKKKDDTGQTQKTGVQEPKSSEEPKSTDGENTEPKSSEEPKSTDGENTEPKSSKEPKSTDGENTEPKSSEEPKSTDLKNLEKNKEKVNALKKKISANLSEIKEKKGKLASALGKDEKSVEDLLNKIQKSYDEIKALIDENVEEALHTITRDAIISEYQEIQRSRGIIESMNRYTTKNSKVVNFSNFLNLKYK